MTERTLTDLDFDSFGLHPTLSQGLHQAGFIRCTPIQALTLPSRCSGNDVAGQAQTGTGKTAAFLVSMFNRLLTNRPSADRKPERAARRDPRADPRTGHPDRQGRAPDRPRPRPAHRPDLRRRRLRQAAQPSSADGTDVIIATPGRLIDFVKQHAVSLRSVEVVVLDEADRMFDLGFIKDIRFLLRRMPARTSARTCCSRPRSATACWSSPTST
jgi:ATP-dependent RNA helicase RhlB